MNRKTVYGSVGVAAALVALMAYGSTRQDAPDNSNRSAEATAAATSMLGAYNTDDYATFSASFTEALLADFDQAAFEEWRDPLITSIGQYGEIIDVTVKDGAGGVDNRYVFHASFDNDESVQFAIVFKPGTDRISRVELKPDK